MKAYNQNVKSNQNNQIILIPQSANNNVNPTNSNHPTLLGAPLLPITNEKPQSAQQKYLEVINEVKREKNMSGY